MKYIVAAKNTGSESIDSIQIEKQVSIGVYYSLCIIGKVHAHSTCGLSERTVASSTCQENNFELI